MPLGAGTPAALLNVLVTANTTQANAALARTQAQLKATATTAQKSSAATGAAVNKNLVRGVGGFAVLTASAVVAAAKFEDAFADVRKTVDATEPQFKRMEMGIRNLAKEIPVSVTELSELAGQAGALGVAAKDIVGFTKVAAQLGTATDLSAGDAANALARLGNILGQKTVKDFQRMGATLVDLGNKGASTEAEISEMSLRIARSGGVVGLSSKQVLGLAASLSNLGIKAESGGTAVSRALLTMSEAIKAGGGELKTFAQVAGLSTEQFGKLFSKDAPTALGLFAEGLVKMNDAGKAVVPTLEKVGLNEIRVRDALLGLGQAQGEVAKGQQIANEAWGKNSALTEEANKKYKTTAAQFQILKNRIFDVGITLGSELLPIVNQSMKAIGQLANGLTKVVAWFKRTGNQTNAVGFILRAVGAGIKDFLNGPVVALVKGARAIAGVWGKVTGVFRDVIKAVNKMGPAMVSVATSIVKPWVKAAQAIRHALTWIVNAVRRVVGAFGDLKDTIPDINLTAPGDAILDAVGRQRGGRIVGGRGTGDKVPAMLEPGEVVINRRAVTAMGGAHKVNSINRSIPRFATGGKVGRPRITGGGVAGHLGQSAIDLSRAAVNKWLQQHIGVGANWASVDKLAQQLGLSVSSSYRPGDPGFHGRRQAKDYSNGVSTAAEFKFGTKLAQSIGPKLLELIHTPLGYSYDNGQRTAPFAQADHYDHVHVALAQRYQKGGGVKAHKPWREVFGSRFDKNELTTLAKFVGMPNPALMAAIAMGESSGSPGIIGDGGDSVGLWQINKPSWGGTNHSLSNPINNAMVAKKVLQQQGLDAWTIYNTGAYRAHLGGRVDMDKLDLLRGTAEKVSKARPGFVPSAQEDSLSKKRTTALRKAGWDYRKGKFGPGWYAPKKKGGGGGAGGEAGVADDPFAAINELIGEQNLLKMQNFNLGMAQHPVLGIPNPASPALGAMVSASSGPFGSSQTIATTGKPSVHSPRIGGPKAKQRLRGQAPVILIEDGAVDARRIRNLSGKEARRALKRAGRRANRRLPSGGGGGP